MTIRLNKLLAQRGLGARRKCDALIQSGAVRVNGEVVKEPGTQVEPERDRVVVNGRPLPGASQHRYYMLHKPVGIITTLQDPEGRRTIRDFLPQGGRVYPVGRLDADTSGLLLLTNDGELAHHLMHPRYGVQKRYRVRVAGEPDTRQLEQLRNGVVFEDGIRSQPADVRVLRHDRDTSLISVTIHEGRYRQVRRMCEAVGLEVRGLHRSGYGPLSLGLLERGLWRELSDEEVAKLRAVSARPMARRNTYGGGVPRGPRAGGPPRSRDDARPREREAPRPSGAGARARDESRGPKRFPGEPARGRFDRGPARRGARPLPGESRPASGERRTFDRERLTGRPGRPVQRERPAGREGRPFERERPAGRGSRPFERERPAGRAGRPFQGERPAGRGSRPVERGRPARAGRSFDRERPAFDRGRGPTSGGRREGRGPDRDRPFDRYRRPSERPRRPSTRDGRPGPVAPSVGRPPGRGQRAPAMPGQRPARSGPFGRSTGFERGGRPAAGGGVRGQRPPGPRGRFERGPRPRPGNAPPRPGRGRTSPPRSPGGGRRPRGPGR